MWQLDTAEILAFSRRYMPLFALSVTLLEIGKHFRRGNHPSLTYIAESIIIFGIASIVIVLAYSFWSGWITFNRKS